MDVNINLLFIGITLIIIFIILNDRTINDKKIKKKKVKKEKMSPINYDPDLITCEMRPCASNELDNIDSKLIRDIVIGRKLQRQEKQTSFDDKEIQKYFDNQQDLYNRTNFNTQNVNDVVEEIAKDRTNNNELNNNNGKTIAEVYDNFTTNNVCKFKDCIIPSQIDDITKRQYYMDENTNNQSYSNFNTRYETDTVNNGGKFYDNISGSYLGEEYMIYTQ